MEIKHVVCETCGKEHLLCGKDIYVWATIHQSNNSGHKVKIFDAPSRRTEEGRKKFDELLNNKSCKLKD